MHPLLIISNKKPIIYGLTGLHLIDMKFNLR